jgi:hypothetical protein
MGDASPTKWRLAHTTWFFETFILIPFASGYMPFDDSLACCFNSYYESAEPPHTRSKRGLLTRPTIEEVFACRPYVDDALREAGRAFRFHAGETIHTKNAHKCPQDVFDRILAGARWRAEVRCRDDDGLFRVLELRNAG